MASNIVEFDGERPKVHDTAFVDPGARIVGDVEIGMYSSVWFGSVVRGDEDKVAIGEYVGVLENCVVEAPAGRSVKVGDYALIAHGAILHGCVVESRAHVGVGAIVLDGARVCEGSIVGAGAVVTPGSIVEKGMVALGFPAKPVREVSSVERRRMGGELMRVMRKSQRYRRLLSSL